LLRRLRRYAFTVPWNLLLLTAGSLMVAFAIKCVAAPHGLLAGGVSGLALLGFYVMPALDPGAWYFLLNVPIMALGWFLVSRRFVLYSLYGMAATSVFIERLTYVLPVSDPWLAVIACGVALGAGEILLTSMDRDGTQDGYDVELTRTVSQAVSVPVIASGGAGQLKHLAEVLDQGWADAVLAASIFHYGKYTISQAKRYLARRGVPVRLTSEHGRGER
jgi:hypothetical protein